jgi:hypothetical protein
VVCLHFKSLLHFVEKSANCSYQTLVYNTYLHIYYHYCLLWVADDSCISCDVWSTLNYPINVFGSEAFRSVIYISTVWGVPSWIEVSDSFYQELVMLVQIVSVFISSFLLFRRSRGILYSRGAELRTLNCIKEMGFKLWRSQGRYWRNKPGIIVGQKGIWKIIVNPNPPSEDGVELFGYEAFWHGWTIDEDVILLACVSFHTFRIFSKQEESVKAFSCIFIMLFLDLKWQFKLVYERKASSASSSKLILDQNRGFFFFFF